MSEKLYHHSSENYQQAADRAVTHAKEQLTRLVEAGSARAGRVIDLIKHEIPTDRLLPGGKLRFQYDTERGLYVVHMLGDHTFGHVIEELSPHALNTALGRVNIPTSMVHRLNEGPEERKLLAGLLTDLFALQNPKDQNLLRSWQGRTKAVLSDVYKIMDSAQIVDAFARACQECGAIPIDGAYMDTRISVRAVVPHVFNPTPHEVYVIGLVLSNSDYRDGALSLKLYEMRLWCTNYAIMENVMRKVHLGKKLDPDMAHSQKTIRLYSEAAASEIHDAVKEYLSPDGKGAELVSKRLLKAAETEVKPEDAEKNLPTALHKDERDKVITVFESPDTHNLPAGNTLLRLSNAVSWVAQSAKTERRTEELQEIAGQMLILESE